MVTKGGIMKFLKLWDATFFRVIPDSESDINMLFFFIAVGISLIVAFNYRNSKKLLNVTLVASILIQLLMFDWYMHFPKLDFGQALPLYYCRIASYLLPLSYWCKWDKLTKFFAWTGIIGAVMSMSFPDPEPYMWPHVSIVTYVGSHIFLAVNGLLILCNSKTKLQIKDILIYTLVMNGIVSIFNTLLNSNYSYLSKLPIDIGFNPGKLTLFIAMSLMFTAAIAGLDWYHVNRSGIGINEDDSCYEDAEVSSV